MSDNDLQGLAQSNMSNVVRLNHVVQKWIDMDGESEGAPVTWTTILDVIKGPIVQNKALALEIYEYLEQQSGKSTCNYFNYYCNSRRSSSVNYIISQYYMEYNRDDILILTISIILLYTSYSYLTRRFNTN